MGSISHHSTLVIFNNLGGCTHMHTHACMHMSAEKQFKETMYTSTCGWYTSGLIKDKGRNDWCNFVVSL